MDWESLRHEMVETQLVRRGITDEAVLAAMREVPRHLFVAPGMESRAYGDHALPIGENQTISQPFMVALMTQALELTGSERVLEIGTGSGYQTAVLSRLAEQVFSIERVESLTARARAVLENLGTSNVAIRVGDGTIGWTEFEPYDRIIVTAGAPDVPPSLEEQLADPGIMVVPVGGQELQQLRIIVKSQGEVSVRDAGGCVFVPLVGKEGWSKKT
ncbi:MAG: protein-L-isoaspartate(D-aspartate) O-methyltransferase [Candidatus Eisenbacteria bacterium]|nr:protein-L-isoaspartate(D-aspartate) O-methyltransferase [Candidatus Eisenbacteria bacterium]